MKKLLMLLALWSSAATAQTLHPPGTPVLPKCTVATYGVSCGLDTDQELVTITDGSGGTPCVTGGAAMIVTCKNVAGTLQTFTGSAGASQLDDLSDVIITSPVINNILSYNGTNWNNSSSGAIKTDLDSLNDVTVTTPSTGDFLRKSAGDWLNTTIALGDLPAGSLVSTEMDDFAEWVGQVSVDPAFACDAKTYIRADGKCYAGVAANEAANPAEAGSDTDGIQEAIDRCPTGGCIVQLACNTTYVLDDVIDTDNQKLLTITAAQDDIWIRGCGAQSTTISFTGNTRTTSTPHSLQAWKIEGDRTRLSDFYFLLDDACGDIAEACKGAGSSESAILLGDISDFRMHNVRVVSRWGALATSHPEYRSIWLSSGSFIDGANFTNNRIEAMARGLEIQFGNNVLVLGNDFFFDRPDDFTGVQGMQSVKYEGIGVQYIGNNFDMQATIGATNPVLAGLIILAKAGDVNVPGEYGQISANVFYNIPGNLDSRAIFIAGYKHGFISNNLFKTGRRCSTELGVSCTVATQVADCASDVCVLPDGSAIDFSTGGGGTGDANRFNIITANAFEGFDDSFATSCPIVIPTPTTSGDNEQNIFADNVFDSSNFDTPTTDDGFCGTDTVIRGNLITNNLISAQGEQCLIGRGVGTECSLTVDLDDTDGVASLLMKGEWNSSQMIFTGASVIHQNSQPGFELRDTAFSNQQIGVLSGNCTASTDCDLIFLQRIGDSLTTTATFDASANKVTFIQEMEAESIELNSVIPTQTTIFSRGITGKTAPYIDFDTTGFSEFWRVDGDFFAAPGPKRFTLGAQTITGGDTITANMCGGIKLITSSGTVVTNTTNTFTAPAAANNGCIFHVCNSGSNSITLDDNPNFLAGGNVVLLGDECVTVGSDGTDWRQLAEQT